MTDAETRQIVAQFLDTHIKQIDDLQKRVAFLEQAFSDNEVANWAIITLYPFLGDEPLSWLTFWRLEQVRKGADAEEMRTAFPTQAEMMALSKQAENLERREFERENQDSEVVPPSTVTDTYDEDLPE